MRQSATRLRHSGPMRSNARCTRPPTEARAASGREEPADPASRQAIHPITPLPRREDRPSPRTAATDSRRCRRPCPPQHERGRKDQHASKQHPVARRRQVYPSAQVCKRHGGDDERHEVVPPRPAGTAKPVGRQRRDEQIQGERGWSHRRGSAAKKAPSRPGIRTRPRTRRCCRARRRRGMQWPGGAVRRSSSHSGRLEVREPACVYSPDRRWHSSSNRRPAADDAYTTQRGKV